MSTIYVQVNNNILMKLYNLLRSRLYTIYRYYDILYKCQLRFYLNKTNL